MKTARDTLLSVGIVIPFHNEEACIEQALDSWCAQTVKPNKLVLIDDGSTDSGPVIASRYADRYNWIELLTKEQSDAESLHLPGSKVVAAFYLGVQRVEANDLIGKFDADIVIPNAYLEQIKDEFADQPKLGVCSGELYIRKDNQWVREPIANPGHVRGPVKLYRRECFKAIGGLKHSLGWDTVDVLLARFHGYDTGTLPELKVKHLRPTGMGYSRRADQDRGIALYKMRYDPLLALISAIKMGWNSRSAAKSLQVVLGYLKGWSNHSIEPYVSPEEGSFIRRNRWNGIKDRLLS